MVIPLPPRFPAGAAPRLHRDAKRPTRELLGGPPTDAPLFGLAPCGVCRAAPVTRGTGGLLPHRFTLAGREASLPSWAVCSLWHFPSRRRDWVLPSAMPCGVRTFLSPECSGQRPSVPLRPVSILSERAIRPQPCAVDVVSSSPSQPTWRAPSGARMSGDITLDKNFPQNVDAERSVLGAILIENHAINRAQEILKHED